LHTRYCHIYEKQQAPEQPNCGSTLQQTAGQAYVGDNLLLLLLLAE
jgi:hypothetical protein